MASFADRIIEHPGAANVEAVNRAWSRFCAAGRTALPQADGAGDPAPADLIPVAAYRDLLDGVFGGSPYLTGLAVRSPALVLELLTEDVGPLLDRELASLAELWRQVPGRAQMAQQLRHIKGRVALLIALADIGGVWNVEAVTDALTRFADASVASALRFLFRAEAERGRLTLNDADDPLSGMGLFIVAMGKMGAGELNYSSDIDLLAFYEPPEGQGEAGAAMARELYPKIIRALVPMMQERTGDGYVLRTDLRLRPDPSVSPLAISAEAALIYYETLAQNWERAAMIKARIAAGAIEVGEQFLAELRPFIWRRHLDFAAIADIQSIKRQIHAHKGHDRIAVSGHDIKVGRGGIREIEFFAQTQQLISGGRDPRLRSSRTVEAIQALAETGRIDELVAGDMVEAYRFLRRLEHRLQMLDDNQTQTLPNNNEQLTRLAIFAGFDGLEDFSEALRKRLETVHGHYADLFVEAPSLAAERGNLVFTGRDDDPDTIRTLAEIGFQSPSGVIATVRGWHSGRYRALRTDRARQRLTDIVPALVKALGTTAEPDAALRRFDHFLSGLPSGIQFMSLLHANPGLLRLLARIMGTAPGMAETLSRNSRLLDCLLEKMEDDLLDPGDAQARAELELAAAEDLEGQLDALRRFANERKFRVGVELLERRMSFDQAGRALSLVAETVLAALLPCVAAGVEVRHGRVGDAGMAVIAMGKLGGREMTFGSDLDLVFVYDDRGEERSSDGKASLSIGPYFTRLSQRYISAITSLTSEGRLYEVDMRLRPSGNSGAVAVPLSAYSDYMRQDAWTWEIMAATRARTIAGPAGLCQAVEDVLTEVVCRPQVEDLRDRVADMRRRIEQAKGTKDIWSVKQVRGGLVDLEFLAQYLILAHAADHPAIVSGNVVTALRRIGDAGLLPAADVTTLIDAHEVLQGLQSLLRLCLRETFREEDASTDLKALLASQLGAGDFDGVRSRLHTAQAAVAEIFERVVGRPGDGTEQPA